MSQLGEYTKRTSSRSIPCVPIVILFFFSLPFVTLLPLQARINNVDKLILVLLGQFTTAAACTAADDDTCTNIIVIIERPGGMRLRLSR